MEQYPLRDIVHIGGIDHPESIGIGPDGAAYTAGTGRQVYKLDLQSNTAAIIAHTEARCLGSVVDADHNLYFGHTRGGDVLKVTPDGTVTTYAVGPGGKPFQCANYPAFDAQGRMYLSDSGDWSGTVNGRICRIDPGGGEAQQWFPDVVDTPNAIALDANEQFLYFVETFGHGISRIAINKDGSAGAFERVVHMPRHVPDGIAFDEDGRL
jgi:sugar lactone lactonase YvrE